MGLLKNGRRSDLAGLAIALVLIALATLTPTAAVNRGTSLPRYLPLDLILNVLLFVPLGFFLRRLGLGRMSGALIGGLLSGAVELAQISYVTGRDASIHDVATNTAGTLAGILLAEHFAFFVRPSRALAAVTGALALGWWIAGSLLMRPELPATRTWYTQWAHNFGNDPAYSLRIVAMRINGYDAPDGRFLSRHQLIDSVSRNGRLEAEIETQPEAPERHGGQIASLVDGEGGEILAVRAIGRGVVVQQRLALERFGLRSPYLLVPAPGLGQASGIDVTTDRKRMSVAVRSADTTRGDLAMSAAYLWTGFSPRTLFLGPATPILTVLFVSAVFLPFGLGAAHESPWLVLGVLVAGLMAVPAALGSGPTPWPGWTGAVFGVGVGRLIGWIGTGNGLGGAPPLPARHSGRPAPELES